MMIEGLGADGSFVFLVPSVFILRLRLILRVINHSNPLRRSSNDPPTYPLSSTTSRQSNASQRLINSNKWLNPTALTSSTRSPSLMEVGIAGRSLGKNCTFALAFLSPHTPTSFEFPVPRDILRSSSNWVLWLGVGMVVLISSIAFYLP